MKLLTTSLRPIALLPIRAIGSLNKEELLDLCVDDLFTIVQLNKPNGVLIIHALQVLNKLNFGLVVHKTPRPGVIHIFNRKLQGQPLKLSPLPLDLLLRANGEFV